MKELQKRLDTLHQELDKLHKEIEENGYYVDENKHVQKKKPDHEVWGLSWDFSYGSMFVGEKGMLMHEGSGAIELTEEQFKTIHIHIEEKDYDALETLLNELTEVEVDVWDNVLAHGRFKVTEEEISWKTNQNGDVEEMDAGSYFEVSKTWNSLIESDEIKFEYDVPSF